MTFEQCFTHKCLNFVEQILLDEKEISKAISHFTEDKTITTRYHLDTIMDAINWNDRDKLHLSAATFEAILRASLHFYAENTDRAMQINSANTVFLEKYIPRITANTNPENRLESVRENIAKVKEDFNEPIEIRTGNPYTFFSPPVTLGLIALTTAVTTLTLLSRNK